MGDFQYSCEMDFDETACICALLLRFQKKRRERKYWVHPIVSRRLFDGQFYKLFMCLREHRKKFFNYFRMSVNSFDTLLRLIGHRITYSNMNMLLAVPPEERLAVTLR